MCLTACRVVCYADPMPTSAPTPPPSLAPASRVRVDDIALASPVRLHTGSVRYTGVAATTDPMVYPWGTERATPEALASEALHEEMRGLPVIMADEMHGDDVTLDTIRDHRVGTITRAWYDADAEELRVEVVIDDPDALAAIERGERRGLSVRYRADTDAEGNQTRRHLSNHIHLTPSPRGGARTQIRADSAAEGDETMDDEQMQALAAAVAEALMERMDAMMERMDGYMERMDAMTSEREDMDGEHGEHDERSDAIAFDTAAKVAALAARRDIDVPDGASVREVQRLVARDLVGDARADAADAAALDLMLAAVDTDAPRERQPVRTGTRSDTADTPTAINAAPVSAAAAFGS